MAVMVAMAESNLRADRISQELGTGGVGYGVTLPFEAGGFPLLLHDPRFHVQACNLMELLSPEDLECVKLSLDMVDVIMADAQVTSAAECNLMYAGILSRGIVVADLFFYWSEAKRRAKNSKNAKQGDESELAGAAGVGAACATLGIWALTFQEIRLGLGMLKKGGTFFFRFGWRGRGDQEEYWYREAIMRLLGLVIAFFDEVFPFKSEIYHQADPCFYVVAAGFQRSGYESAALDTRSVHTRFLQGCIETLAEFSTPASQQRIDELLDTVSRVRAIGLSSRSTVEAGGRESPEAQLIIRPVPYHLTMQRLRERMECYGKIAYIRRRSHAVGVGADALIQFVQPAHAKMALEVGTSCKLGFISDFWITSWSPTHDRLSMKCRSWVRLWRGHATAGTHDL
ncbi:unnamed protein product [Symbiodinium pilosum]|uniref:RRM domain-containing protein n=1 Tax=Symbiodinium pilosum TaxID=2952 RepID=A0A812WX61_SYMPI|nr:unnamed protein product [Symbiodinium pilosum]